MTMGHILELYAPTRFQNTSVLTIRHLPHPQLWRSYASMVAGPGQEGNGFAASGQNRGLVGRQQAMNGPARLAVAETWICC